MLLELGIIHSQKGFIAGISYSCARGDSYTNLVSLSRHVACSKSLFTWTFYHMELSTFSYRNLSAALYFQSENIARQTLFSLFLLWKSKKKKRKKRRKNRIKKKKKWKQKEKRKRVLSFPSNSPALVMYVVININMCNYRYF